MVALRRSRAGLTAISLVFASLPAGVGPARAHEAVDDARTYFGVVAAYRRGDANAVPRILAWDPHRMLRVLERVDVRPGGNPLWDGRSLAAAAFMHTEAAWQRLDPDVPAVVALHLDIAGRLLEKGSPSLDGVASRWYVAVTRGLRARGRDRLAERILERGRKRLAGDAAVLCESGILAEFLATDTTLDGVGELDERVGWVWTRHTTNLDRAERWLTQAAKNGHASESCTLHLGRVLTLLSKVDRAGPLLAALQSSKDEAIAYLASMFLGAAAERQGNKDDAERQYRVAVAKGPRGHAAHFALAGVLLSQGRPVEARHALQQGLDGERNSRREPWWWYFSEPKPATAARLDALRSEVLP